MDKIVFLCGARDFHAMDWYKSAKKKLGVANVAVMADIISAEGMNSLLQADDELIELFIIDKWLFSSPSRIGDLWRNILKLFLLPIQAYKLKQYYDLNPHSVFYAHGMYYMQIAALAGVPYVGTPQGSELLVRPYRSRLYKYFAIKALRAAKFITVDSINMQKSAEEISGIRPHIIQNGIDVKSILQFVAQHSTSNRDGLLSIRGFTKLYREIDILNARNSSIQHKDSPIMFVYPFFDEQYLEEAKPLMIEKDALLGRLQRTDLYEKLANAKVVISIPSSDSSPRSVYEAIFLGCPVVITRNSYVDMLPRGMQERIVIANIEENNWFDKAVNHANEIALKPFTITDEYINMFDQEACFDKVYALLIN